MTMGERTSRSLSSGDRVVYALVLGGWGAFIAYFSMLSHPHHLAKDFSYPWRAARALLDGQNPYEVIQAVGAYPFNAKLFYPLPAAVVALPFSTLAPHVAGALFVGISSALLAWGLLRDSPYRLWVFLSAPFVHAAILGQWSPLLMAAALLPALQAFAAAKPTIGLVAWIYRPSLVGIAGGAVLALIAFVLAPGWVGDWLAAAGTTGKYRGPATTAAGAFLLLGLLRWRLREGRLFVALSLVPQLPVFYDTLPLWLVPSTARRAAFLTMTSWIAYALWYPSRMLPSQNEIAIPLTLAGIWAPALLLLLMLPGRPPAPNDRPAAPPPDAPGSPARPNHHVRHQSPGPPVLPEA
jgi:hypothetical protein